MGNRWSGEKVHLKSPWGKEPELDALLTKLWNAGELSTRQMAKLPEFSRHGLSYNALIGRAGRLNLGKKARSNGSRPARFATTRVVGGHRPSIGRITIHPPRLTLPKFNEIPPPDCRPVGILELDPFGCRWIVAGEKQHALFCNADAHDMTSRPGHWCYCHYHMLRLRSRGPQQEVTT